MTRHGGDRARIKKLSDQPEVLSEAATWVWEAWPVKSYAETRDSLDNPAKCPPTLIAVAGDRPVGVISFGRWRRPSDISDSLWINALYVVEDERTAGLGSRLLSEAVEIAGRQADDLFVYTDIGNWYQDRGWTPIETDDGGSTLHLHLH